MKYLDRIRGLPHVQSIEWEGDRWCCHLYPGLTTAALDGGGTVIDTDIRAVWAYAKGPPLPAQQT